MLSASSTGCLLLANFTSYTTYSIGLLVTVISGRVYREVEVQTNLFNNKESSTEVE